MAATFVESGGQSFLGAEAVLRTALERARRAWPHLGVEVGSFVAHLARHAGHEADVAASLAQRHVDDLYLAFACAAGDAVAIAAFDVQVLAPAVAYVRSVHRRADGVIDEATQRLRVRLLVREPGREPSIAGYGGRAPLGAWLRVAAIREVRALLRQGSRAAGDAQGNDDRPPAHAVRAASPELDFLKKEGNESMSHALERALQALDEKDRALLRLYFVEGMPLATLGRIYHVHESTMARRLQALRNRLLDDVKGEMEIGTTSVHGLRALVESQLDVHLSEVLRRPR